MVAIFLIALTRPLRRLLDRDDVPGDFFGRFGGLSGEAFDLLRHYGKAAPGFSGAGSLDRRVEREQVRLRGNAADEIAYFADFIHRGRQALDRLGDCFRLVGG